MKPDPKQPLWLPAGSIRALLALVLVVAVVVMGFLGRIDANKLWDLGAIVVTAYFVSKAAQAKT